MENARKNPEFSSEETTAHLKQTKNRFDGATGLRELMLLELQALYFTEKMLVKAFPRMIKNACSFELIEAISQHAEVTKKQIIRIEDTFDQLTEKPIMQRCEAIENMLDEIEQIIEASKFGIVRDAGIVLSLHKIEHYEIAAYSILETYAENLCEEQIQQWIHLSLNEEKIAQMRLAKIATTLRFYDPKD